MAAALIAARKSTSKSAVKINISQADLETWGLCGVKLRPYQLGGVCWLAERYAAAEHGCILGDEMGLGKTLQV